MIRSNQKVGEPSCIKRRTFITYLITWQIRLPQTKTIRVHGTNNKNTDLEAQFPPGNDRLNAQPTGSN